MRVVTLRALNPASSLSERVVLCVQRQAAAVRMLLSLFRLCILALEVSERYVQRLVSEADWMMFIDATSANFRLAENRGVVAW